MSMALINAARLIVDLPELATTFVPSTGGRSRDIAEDTSEAAIAFGVRGRCRSLGKPSAAA
jgi:hypothetical protein